MWFHFRFPQATYRISGLPFVRSAESLDDQIHVRSPPCPAHLSAAPSPPPLALPADLVSFLTPHPASPLSRHPQKLRELQLRMARQEREARARRARVAKELRETWRQLTAGAADGVPEARAPTCTRHSHPHLSGRPHASPVKALMWVLLLCV